MDYAKKKITENIQNNINIDIQFIDQFYDTLVNQNQYISYNDANKWIGFKKKQTIKDILLNTKYDFKQGQDYKIEILPSTGGRPGDDIKMTMETIKSILLMCQSKTGQKFRRYYLEMEKLFKKYVSTEIINKLTNPIIELNKYEFDINQYKNKEVMYLINIKDDINKYGITRDIQKRLRQHKHLLKYNYVVKCWETINRTISKKIEDDIKLFMNHCGYNFSYDNETELFKMDNLENIIKIFDKYVNKHIQEHRKQYQDESLTQKLELVNKINDIYDKLKKDNQTKLTTDLLDMIKTEKETLEHDNSNIENIHSKNNINDDLDNEIFFQTKECSRCKKKKIMDDFGINDDTNEYFVQCILCRAKERNNLDRKLKKRQYTKKWRDEHYQEQNKKLRILRKEIRKENNLKKQNLAEDDNLKCNRCFNKKLINQFDINPKTKQLYSICTECKLKRDNYENKKNKNVLKE
ncbi:Hypothetical protein KVN_LOCUS505 [uncultured virus]|nr:Hypothetical protein KVN_LOCUS505 [uncultured virus]